MADTDRGIGGKTERGSGRERACPLRAESSSMLSSAGSCSPGSQGCFFFSVSILFCPNVRLSISASIPVCFSVSVSVSACLISVCGSASAWSVHSESISVSVCLRVETDSSDLARFLGRGQGDREEEEGETDRWRCRTREPGGGGERPPLGFLSCEGSGIEAESSAEETWI